MIRHLVIRRAFAFLAALSVTAIGVAQQASPAAAETSAGTLYALGPSSIGVVDPATASFTTLAQLPVPPNSNGGPNSNLAADPSGHRLFVSMTAYLLPDFTAQYQLVTVDTQNGAVSVSPPMAQGLTQLAFDPSTGALFGQTNMCCPFELVRVDPSTGVQTKVADIPGEQPLGMTAVPSRHALYFGTEAFNGFPPTITIVTVDTQTGDLTQSPALAKGVVYLAYDSSLGKLFGKSFCCPAGLLQVDPVTGAETTIGSGLNLGEGFAVDAASHNIFMTDDELGAYGFQQFVDSVNDQTGAISPSTGALPSDTFVSSLAFVAPVITPQQLEADVQSAIASNAISKAGTGTSLLAELKQAHAARDRGQCPTSANLYQAFVNEVSGQSGKAIDAATAQLLISEAQFLITNCP